MSTDRSDRQGHERMRRSHDERRAEIAEATLRLMARYGLQGTTVSRIASEVGIAPQSLYTHFTNQNEMLSAAIDPLIHMTDEWLDSSSNPDAVERLREIGENHFAFLSDRLEGFVIPANQFLVAPPDTGLPAAFGERHREQLQKVAEIVEEGKRQGTIREDVDPLRAAWRLFVVAFVEDLAQLMRVPEFIEEGISKEILDVLLQDLAPCPDDKAEGGRA